MAKLLHIECSPRKDRSASIEVAQSFISRLLSAHPDLEVTTLDLWQISLPEFSDEVMDAKYSGLNGLELTATQVVAWNELKALANYLHEADVLVLSVPLWNFSIPYKLKHFIDVVSQKDVLFSFNPETGLEGMLRDKKAVVVYARGMDFSAASLTPAQHFDFQKPYVEAWLRLIGITDVESIIVEKTLLGSEVDSTSRHEAKRRANALADALSVSDINFQPANSVA